MGFIRKPGRNHHPSGVSSTFIISLIFIPILFRQAHTHTHSLTLHFSQSNVKALPTKNFQPKLGLFDWAGLIYPCHSQLRLFSILSKRPVYIISGFDAAPQQYHQKLPWQIPGRKKKNISLPAQLYYSAYSITTAGVASEQPRTLQNPPAWPEMKWWNLPQFKLIHTSHLWHDWFSFRVLKYGIVFLPFFHCGNS